MNDGHTRRLQAILAADVVGYTRLMNRDEEGTLGRLQTLEREVVDPAVAGHGGEIVKRLGDGVLAVFPSAVNALRAARAIRAQAAQKQGGTAEPIAYRIGINLGDVIVSGNDIFGDGVNIAARLEGLADPGGIALSAAVHDNVRAQDPGPFDDLGEQWVKNIEHPVRVYRVRYPDSPSRRAGGERTRRVRLALALLATLLGAVAVATWILWPAAEAPVASVPPSEHTPSPAARTDPVPAPADTAPIATPAPVTRSEPEGPSREVARPVTAESQKTTEPGFGERLLDSIAESIEEELAAGSSATAAGPPGKNRSPPGKGKKDRKK